MQPGLVLRSLYQEAQKMCDELRSKHKSERVHFVESSIVDCIASGKPSRRRNAQSRMNSRIIVILVGQACCEGDWQASLQHVNILPVRKELCRGLWVQQGCTKKSCKELHFESRRARDATPAPTPTTVSSRNARAGGRRPRRRGAPREAPRHPRRRTSAGW